MTRSFFIIRESTPFEQPLLGVMRNEKATPTGHCF